ncbi:MAG: CheR family methyltransferase [Ignavibacteriaceae bacterium]|nr:CheR family methyltransferase [Ignavibacteriaceae bacterium]
MKKDVSRKSEKVEPVRHERAKTSIKLSKSNKVNNFFVAGIGASAGGVEAFIKMVREIPINSGIAYVLIQHLDPTHKSHLIEIIARETKLPVMEVTEGMHVTSDRIFVIPSSKDIKLLNGKFKLSSRSAQTGLHLPIDSFFKSIAENYAEHSIGVVLSGTGADGSEGLKFIKEADGITFVQDPKTCKYDGMPINAIATLDIDYVLPPERIAEEIIKISKNSLQIENVGHSIDEALPSSGSIEKLFNSLRLFSGTDFSGYKPSTIKRRISRRMFINKIENLDEYIEYLKNNTNEVKSLYNDLLITVTGFFRDAKIFDTLRKNIFPEFMKEEQEEMQIRIWVPGCSTGEEAYSIAITLLEFLESKKRKYLIKIFATDINELVIEKARMGIYTSAIEESVSPERLKNYFYKMSGGYQVIKPLREICIFAKQDVSQDPPFSKLDLISCRNLLIYLNPSVQKRVINTFHYALKPNGFLVLGSSETIGGYADLFTLTDKQYKIYVRKQTFQKLNMNFSFPENIIDKPGITKPEATTLKDFDIQKEADKIILNNYMPAGVVIDGKMNIVQFRGNTGKYLSPTPGSASLNLFKMTHENLMLELRGALTKVKKSEKRYRKNNIQVRNDGIISTINFEVIPMNISAKTGESFYLITLEDAEGMVLKSNSITADAPKGKKKESPIDEATILKLKEELTVTKEYLQSIIEEREATNEELRSTLEELQSTNEELQSINEEMETAKEELQSTNEELTTLNEELQNGNSELNQVNNDLVNLLNNVQIPIIMLGEDLKIRRFTPNAEKVLNLIASDIGRPISDLRMNLSIGNLNTLIYSVINSLESVETDIQIDSEHWYSMRIRPYKTIENKIEGVILTFIENNKVNPVTAG